MRLSYLPLCAFGASLLPLLFVARVDEKTAASQAEDERTLAEDDDVALLRIRARTIENMNKDPAAVDESMGVASAPTVSSQHQEHAESSGATKAKNVTTSARLNSFHETRTRTLLGYLEAAESLMLPALQSSSSVLKRLHLPQRPDSPYTMYDTLLGYGLVVFCVLGVLVAWVASSKVGEPPQETSEMGKTSRWLFLLSCSSLALFMLQLVIAAAFGSQALRAEVSHAASDTISYALAFLIERAKCRLPIGPSSVRAMTDACSGVLIAAIALVPATIAVVASIHCIRGEAHQDIRGIGALFLGWSLAATSVKLAVLVLYFEPWQAKEDELQPQRPPIGTRLLQMIIYPGRDMSGDGGEGDMKQGELNLNIYSAMLHLTADILRTVLLLTSGALLMCGVLHKATKAGAFSSLLMNGCVIIGSIPLVRAALPTAWEYLSTSEG
eukprot:gnl/TRDRNA2_/TRDRNA2_130934_c0_seq1.p1 gnl/TRDRNA2_/TRDRNA2_130934_c0~~gnl/TRDRNA2_/TRDRNA2_130934_c0_seq1.p1  ORF type:complete len:441 (-),score=59.39 gnl/TRDRNA2_/TRDRNA2_130934_c0_seq1:32-1354(-)